MWMFDMLPEGAFEPRPGGGMRLHGGKGGGAPAPDPRLIEAQIKSLGIQDDVIQRVIGNSERLQPLQEEQLRQGIDATKLAQSQSQEDRTYSLARRNALTGLQDRLTSDAKAFNTEQRSDELAGQAVGDVRQAFGSARTAQMRDLTRQGVNPNDGRRAAFDNQFSVAEALATATAANKTRQTARMEGLALTDRATNALAGYPAQSMQATAAGAGFGAAGLGLANQGLAGVNSGFGQAGAIAGQQGSNASSAYGTQANAYNQAQSNKGEATGAILGAAATVAAAF